MCILNDCFENVLRSLIIMDQDTSQRVIAQALLGDTNVLSAVTSLLKKHNVTKKSSMLARLEDVHALATASLVASTQRDIVEQLAQHDPSTTVAGIPSITDTKSADTETSDNCRTKEEKTSRKKANKKGFKDKQIKVSSKEKSYDLDMKSEDLPKALICSYDGCGRKFAWQTHLQYHELTHTNNRQHKCPKESCDKTFFTGQQLRVHLRSHTGERPFECPHHDCGKSFTTAGNLKNHQRLHTGEKPFVCDHLNCKKSFAEQSSLKKHKITHSGNRPFVCGTCSKTFTQSSSLKKHVLRHQLAEEMGCSTECAADGFDDMEQEGVDQTQTNDSSKAVAEVSSPQVIVLKNTFHGVPNSEPMMMGSGLRDHMVTVRVDDGGGHSGGELKCGGQEALVYDKSQEFFVKNEDFNVPDDTTRKEAELIYTAPCEGTKGDLIYTATHGATKAEVIYTTRHEGREGEIKYTTPHGGTEGEVVFSAPCGRIKREILFTGSHGRTEGEVIYTTPNGGKSDLVYTTDILQSETLPSASFVTAHVDYHGDITSDFFHHQELNESEEVTQEVDYVTRDFVRMEDVEPKAQHLIQVEYGAQLSSDEHQGLTESEHLNQQTDVQNIFSGYLSSECFHLPDTELMVAEEVTTSGYDLLPHQQNKSHSNQGITQVP